MRNLFKENIKYYLSVFLLVISFSVVLLGHSKYEVTLMINSHFNRFFDSFFIFFNAFGTVTFSVILILLLSLVDTKKGIQAVICFLLVMAITQIAKYFFYWGEVRPLLYFAGKYPLRLVEGVVMLETESFPSGHTSSVFAIATFFVLSTMDKRYAWLLVIPAFLTAYSRMYMSQHFITDVYAGMIIGVIITTVCYYFIQDKFTGVSSVLLIKKNKKEKPE